jgi:hypothetical protein
MLPLGEHTRIGEYEVWLTTPVFTIDNQDPKAQELPYYEVFLTRIAEFHFYVDVGKFMSLNLTDRNPLHAKVFGAKPKKSKDGEEIEHAPMTPEEVEFRDEYQFYQSRKDMGMPLWKLSRRHVEELLQSLESKVAP